MMAIRMKGNHSWALWFAIIVSARNRLTWHGMKTNNREACQPFSSRSFHLSGSSSAATKVSMANCQLAQFAGFGVLIRLQGCTTFHMKNFHRETANRSRTSVTFLFLANASRPLHFRILLDSEKLEFRTIRDSSSQQYGGLSS